MEHIKHIPNTPSHTVPDEILGSTKVPGRQSAAPSDVRWRPGRPGRQVDGDLSITKGKLI